MKVVLIGGFCELEELCVRAGHEIVHIVHAGEDAAYQMQGDRTLPLVVAPDGALRKKVSLGYESAGFQFATIIARTADVSPSAVVLDGAVVSEHAIVNAQSHLGRFVKVNTAATITHECVVGDYATVAPRAVLLGRVKVGEGAYIGANATVLPGIEIGANAVVGAGAVVTKDVPAGAIWAGVPAKELVK